MPYSQDCHDEHVHPSASAMPDVTQQQDQHQQGARLAALRASLPRTWPLTAALPPPGARVPNWAHVRRAAGLLGHNPPCTSAAEGDVWLNRPDVRSALHAAPRDITGRWTICSDVLHYHHDAGSMIPIHHKLTQHHGG